MKPLPLPPEKPRQPFKFIPAEVRAEKLTKGLCYNCDQKYERGHKCSFKEKQLFTVEIPSCLQEDYESEENDEVELEISEPRISVNALSGNQSFSTMRVKGVVQGIPLYVLIDSGNTHNFLYLETTKKLGCTICDIKEQAIVVADGNHISCQHMVKGFQ